MKNNISSYELFWLSKELEIIHETRINNVFLSEDYSLILELYSASLKKKYLQIKVPVFVFLRDDKPETTNVNSFAKQMRDTLTGLVIKKVEQIGADRVIQIDLSNQKTIIIELYLRGNIIVLDHDGKIEFIMDKKKYEKKATEIGSKYEIPDAAFDYKQLSIEKIEEKINEDKSVSTGFFIATKLNLGKDLSDYVCQATELDKNKFANELDKEEKSKLIKEINNLTQTKPNISFDNKLIILPNTKNEFDTISKGIIKLYEEGITKKITTKYTNQINRVKNLIRKQKKLYSINEKKEEEYNNAGNKLYENYEEINNSLKLITENENILDDKEFLAKSNIKKVNKKNKTIIVEFN